jgi:proteasome lid subunit RPN8/RPN11
MSLVLNRLAEDKIRGLAEGAYPSECCGFLIGRADRDERLVEEVRPAENLRTDSNTRYLISPKSFLLVEKELEEKPRDIMGFFHSHPDVAAIPSEYDRDHAWPWYSYLIVSVRKGKAAEIRCWRLKEDRSDFESEQLSELE